MKAVRNREDRLSDCDGLDGSGEKVLDSSDRGDVLTAGGVRKSGESTGRSHTKELLHMAVADGLAKDW